MIKDLSPLEFVARRTSGVEMTLLDVREDWEVKLAPAPTPVVHMPMTQVEARLPELDPSKECVVLCRSGGRSLQVARFLEQRGFRSVSNLAGGILAWSSDLDPTIPQY